jgi:hypothetical protein
VALFRRLFRGRDDLYPKLWTVRMFEKRLRGYRAIGYTRDDDPFNNGADAGEWPVDDETAGTLLNPVSRKTPGSKRGRRPKRASGASTTPW